MAVTLVLLGLLGHVFGASVLPMDTGAVEEMTMQPPAFCHKLDCPKYSVLQTFKTYELRQYEPSMWIASNITTMEFTESDERELFDRLFYYISGNNTKHQKIAMTAPVLRTILHGQGPDCESTFITHFMIPFELQTSPPTPTDSRVFLTNLPKISVYVRSFGGYTNGTSIQENLVKLADDISDPKKFVPNPYYVAGYDNPYQVLNRHNEIWLQQAAKE